MKKNEKLLFIGIIVTGAILPWIVSSEWRMVLTIFFYYAILSISWNIVFGYAGLFSYGHVAFPAIGGYVSAILATRMGLSPFGGLLMGGIAAGIIGLLIGLLLLRVRGFYLCLITWAFAEVLNVIIKAEESLTGGTGGFVTQSFFNGPSADLYGYFLGLFLMLSVFVVSATIFHSRAGLYLFSIRDDIDAAESMGINTRLWKVLGFAIGSLLAGFAGAFYAHYFGLIDPTIGGLDEMGKVCLMVIIGGVGSLFGPLLGALFVVVASEIIRSWVGNLSMFIFAAIMILTVRFVRGGFIQILQALAPNFKKGYSGMTPDPKKSV